MGPSGCKEGHYLIVFLQDLYFSPTEKERGGQGLENQGRDE